MKKLKILIFFVVLPYIAQCQTDEYSLSYSPLSVYKLGHRVEEGLEEKHHTVLGAVNVEYYKTMNNWLKLGISVMYDQEKSEGIVTSGSAFEYEKMNSVFVIAPQVDFEYVSKKNFKLRSGLGFGYAFNKHTSTKGLDLDEGMRGVTVNFNLISFRWGEYKGLYGYMGLGYKGFLGLGYFVRL
jgi:hypothetical protein